MAYVAAKGGEAAIQQAEAFYHALKSPATAQAVALVQDTMPYLVDRVMGEGSLYAPDLAALALVQSGGDLHEAVLLLRAYRSTLPRLAYALPVEEAHTLVVRRISAAFKDIPGGQVLGPTLDYSHRVLALDVLDGPGALDADAPTLAPSDAPATPSYPLVNAWHRANGLLPQVTPEPMPANPSHIPDVTRDAVRFPGPRAHRLQALARAETGGVLALGYAAMRGYGFTHPTVNELRLGHAEVRLTHPLSGQPFSAGRVRVGQGEVISEAGAGYVQGFTACLGWNEVKLIAGATLDMEMSQPQPHPAHTEDFVLYHTESVESSGFCIHFKLPHYVTFSSGMDAIRRAMAAEYPAYAPATPPEAASEAAAPTKAEPA